MAYEYKLCEMKMIMDHIESGQNERKIHKYTHTLEHIHTFILVIMQSKATTAAMSKDGVMVDESNDDRFL